jgi:hypothetical protein
MAKENKVEEIDPKIRKAWETAEAKSPDDFDSEPTAERLDQSGSRSPDDFPENDRTSKNDRGKS